MSMLCVTGVHFRNMTNTIVSILDLNVSSEPLLFLLFTEISCHSAEADYQLNITGGQFTEADGQFI